MGKSYEAVFSPQNFRPSLMDDSHILKFEQNWLTKKPWILSNMSHIAYFKQSDIENFMNALKVKKTCIYDQDGAQGFLAIWADKAILVFRGSQPREENSGDESVVDTARRIFSFDLISSDVRADMDLSKTQFDDIPDVTVHSGFLREINKLWNDDQVLANLNECTTDGIPIWVTGHSLGAAMATLAGMRYGFESVTTFGEPRVGSNIGSAFKSKEHIRYVNGDDPVTMIPLEEPLLNYKHHGVERRISDPDGSADARYDHSIVYYSDNLA
jgi:hypothetical protein